MTNRFLKNPSDAVHKVQLKFILDIEKEKLTEKIEKTEANISTCSLNMKKEISDILKIAIPYCVTPSDVDFNPESHAVIDNIYIRYKESISMLFAQRQYNQNQKKQKEKEAAEAKHLKDGEILTFTASDFEKQVTRLLKKKMKVLNKPKQNMNQPTLQKSTNPNFGGRQAPRLPGRANSGRVQEDARRMPNTGRNTRATGVQTVTPQTGGRVRARSQNPPTGGRPKRGRNRNAQSRTAGR